MDGIAASIREIDPRAEARHLEMLDELAEMGMAVARELKQRIVQPADDAEQPDIERLGVVFTRVARAVRQTVAIYSRLKRDLTVQVEKDAAAQQAERSETQARAERVERARARFARSTVERLVQQSIGEAAKDDYEASGMFDQLYENVDAFESFGWLEDKPIGEIVARICDDLGIDFDWAKHQDEPWAEEEIRDKPKGSPYAEWPPPAEDGESDDDEDVEKEPALTSGRGPPGR